MNIYLHIKRINTESVRDGSGYKKLSSTTSSNRFDSTPKQTESEAKRSTSDFKAFKAKHKVYLQERFNCLRLINLPYPNSFVTNADLLKLQFSPLSYPIKDLIVYAKSIIQSNYERKLMGRSFNLLKLIQAIADNYNISAYHNFTHAFSVLLLLYQSYSRSARLQSLLSQRQWFYVFIAALIHDLNHPGTTNAFEVKQRSKLAVEAGNQAVLEKMHLSSFWKLLKGNSQINFLQGYSLLEANEIRRLITRLVMSTDAARHAQGVEGLRELHKYRKALKGQNTIILIEQLFHGCDIGNSCLPFENYISWSVLISYEFDRIAVREEELGMEVTSFLKYEGLDKFYRGQLVFSSTLVLPLWKEISHFLPELDEMLYNVIENIEELRSRIPKELS